MSDNKLSKGKNPWSWIPTLYFFQGVPYSIVMITSGLIYKTMGISVASFAFWTSILYLPWAIKPLWSPYIEVVSTKRQWVLVTQLLLAVAFLVVGFVMQLPFFYPLSLVLFGIIAISSASHDIAADGFYMLALDQHQQSFFVGIRSTFYRFAMLSALGILPVMAGLIQENTGLEPVNFEVEAVAPGALVNQNVDAKHSQLVDGENLSLVISSTKLQMPFYEEGGSDSVLVYVSLSGAPDEGEVIVANLMRKEGTKDIDFPKHFTGRLEFTSENWNVPVAVPVRINHNVKDNVSALFTVSAGNIALSWTFSLGILGVLLFFIAMYHRFMLPVPSDNTTRSKVDFSIYIDVFKSFFGKPGVVASVLFFLLFRFGEAQLVKIATPFLVDSRTAGGIGLSAAQYGLVYGTVGMLSLTLGGILGGIFASRFGLKRVIWYMVILMNSANVVYVLLAHYQPMPGNPFIYLGLGIEQFGYGFGFTSYMLYMLHYVCESKYKTAEFAIGTSLMAIGMMVPGMISGYVKDLLGYENFFIYAMICSIPGMVLIKFLKIDAGFGLKQKG